MPNNQLKIKLGDTFATVVTFTDILGNPLIGISAKLKSQIRDQYNKLYADLTITETELGKYLMKTDTTNWIVGTLLMDIQYTDLGIVTSSDTIIINVGKDVTV